MTQPKAHPPRGYVDKDEWLSLYDRSDPGDIAKPVSVKFIPHRDFLPKLIHVMPVEEHQALLAEARAEAFEEAASIISGYYADLCGTDSVNCRAYKRIKQKAAEIREGEK